MSMNRPDPSKAIHVKRGARRTPDGVKSCTTNVRRMSRRELRIFRDELAGKAPEWTWNGVCYRPSGKWHDTHAGGEYVTANIQEIKRRLGT